MVQVWVSSSSCSRYEGLRPLSLMFEITNLTRLGPSGVAEEQICNLTFWTPVKMVKTCSTITRDQKATPTPTARPMIDDRDRYRDQEPPRFVATLVLQDTLVRMLSILEGVTQSSIFPRTPNGSHKRTIGQTPDQHPVLAYHTMTTGGSFQKMVNASKDDELMRSQEFGGSKEKRPVHAAVQAFEEGHLNKILIVHSRVLRGTPKNLPVMEGIQIILILLSKW
ncbi:hypothetical protein HAX54_052654 [Datura stramonium]|uniref:Uncharacterized protein n=1 Tax=Datura stramonium TaxID=4076 RepID=A0ABS8SZT8_DATST|nr:hypothetical protein [Datura stramonium]